MGKLETVTDFIFWGSRITADGDCSHEIKKYLLQNQNKTKQKKTLAPWKKSYDQPRQHIKKQRHYFANKGPPSQSYGFSSSHVWMWELDYKESWAPKNWWFGLWCWRRLLRVPWTARRANQSILKEISPECSLEGLMLKLKLQYFDHLMQRTDALERPWWWERLRAGGEGIDRGWDGWMSTDSMDMNLSKALGVDDGQGSLACCSSWSSKESDMTERLNWMQLIWGAGYLKGRTCPEEEHRIQPLVPLVFSWMSSQV